jgi:hypothetical protein
MDFAPAVTVSADACNVITELDNAEVGPWLVAASDTEFTEI